MKELKSCPFCGNTHISAVISYEDKTLSVCCDSDSGCIACMTETFYDAGFGDGSFISFQEMENAINSLVERWNNRYTETVEARRKDID